MEEEQEKEMARLGAELRYLFKSFKPGVCKKLMRTFIALSANKEVPYENQARYYITRKSYYENFKLVFGYEYSIIRDRFWHILSEGKLHTKVTFFTFIEKLEKFVGGHSNDEAEFVFQFFDFNNDGLLDSKDIVTCLAEIAPSCVLAEELGFIQ